jgi:hypothetical protein
MDASPRKSRCKLLILSYCVWSSELTHSLSSFLSPVTPTNPLNYIPDFDPLIDKLKRKFGTVPPPPEKGSAILAPGQKKPQSQSPAPAAPAPAVAKPSTAKKQDSQSWQDLIKLAAEKYVQATGSVITESEPIPMEPFLELANTSLLASLGKRARTAESSAEGSESPEGSPMAIDGTADGEDRKPKKKKRVRKGRVGH